MLKKCFRKRFENAEKNGKGVCEKVEELGTELKKDLNLSYPLKLLTRSRFHGTSHAEACLLITSLNSFWVNNKDEIKRKRRKKEGRKKERKKERREERKQKERTIL